MTEGYAAKVFVLFRTVEKHVTEDGMPCEGT